MGLNLAGRFNKVINQMHPGLPETLATAALSGGLSVAGNGLTNQINEKGAARTITEALGAAGLGALAGAGTRALRQKISSPLNEIKAKGYIIDTGNYVAPVDKKLIDSAFNLNRIGTGALGAGAVTVAGGMGGMLGGGIANAVGVPQSEPELPMAVRPALASQNVQQYLAGLQGAQGAPAMMIPVDA